MFENNEKQDGEEMLFTTEDAEVRITELNSRFPQ